MDWRDLYEEQKLTVCQWSDGDWCFLEDLEERLFGTFAKSDDYKEVQFDRKKHVIHEKL
jgi:hypothetical protein